MGEDVSVRADTGTEPTADAGESGTEPRVIITFRPDLIAAWLASKVAPLLLVELGDQLIGSGYTLRQLHSDATDVQLAAWFEVVAPDMDGARRVLAQLRGHPAVVAAYLKPPDALPG